MKWNNESADNPGYSVYHATGTQGTLYVIRQKRKTPEHHPVGWRVFARNKPGQTLKTIYMAETLKECKAFVADLEETLTK